MALTTLASLWGLLLLLLLLLGDTVQAAFNVVSTTSSSLPTSQDAEYVCFFESLWTAADHPNDFPASAGFSQPIIVVHSSEYDLFVEGAVASAGMKSLAETGSIIEVVTEIFEVNGDEDNIVVDTVVGMETDVGSIQRQTLRGLEVDDMHALLSAAVRISPSPDWFTGFSDFDPRDSTTNTWYYEFNLQTPPYDAGTQEGETYLQSLGGTTPAEPIVEITVGNAPTSGAFLNSAGDAVLPVAEWSCRLVNGQAATPGATPATPPATTPAVPTLSPVATTAAPSAILSATPPPTMPTTMAPSFMPSSQPSTARPSASFTLAGPTAGVTTTQPTANPTAASGVERATTSPTTTPLSGSATVIPTAAFSTAPGPSNAPSSTSTETTDVSIPSDQNEQSTSEPTLSPVVTSSASPSSSSDYPTTVPTLELSSAPSDVPSDIPTTVPLTNEPTIIAEPTSPSGVIFPSEAPVSVPADEAPETDPAPMVAPSTAPSMQPSIVPTTETDANQINGSETTSTAGKVVLPMIYYWTWIVSAVVITMLL